MTPGEGGTAAAGHTVLQLRYYRTQETPRVPEEARGGQERHQKDRRAHGGCKRHQGDWRENTGDRSGPQGQRDPKLPAKVSFSIFLTRFLCREVTSPQPA